MDNVKGALIVAIVELVLLVLGLAGGSYYHGYFAGPAWLGGVAFVAAIVGAICLLIGALKRMEKLILVWIIISIVSLVIFIVFITLHVLDGGTISGIVGVIIFIIVKIWCIFIGLGAREECLGGAAA